MKDLNEIRKQINKIDEELAKLFEERMNLCGDVACFKKENNMKIYDSSREQEVISRNSLLIKDENIKRYYLSYLNNMLELSKTYQSSLINEEIEVLMPNGNYSVVIKRNSLKNIEDYIDLNRKVLVVTDSLVPKEYSECVLSKTKEGYLFVLDSGESSKSLKTYSKVIEFLIEKEFSRSDLIVAVGGGVVGDLCGFVSSTYLRGIEFVNVPTTVLSSLDASIGSKNGINFMNVKNMVGSFYNPKKVIIDVETFKTLNKRIFNEGIAEAIKIAFCLDEELFINILNCDIHESIESIIKCSIIHKIHVVESDPYEKNIRKVLNFGHTIGHAIEILSKGSLYHGEAVSIGMMFCCKKEIKPLLEKALKKFNLPTICDFSFDELKEIIKHDKKMSNGRINYIFVEKIGEYKIKNSSIDDFFEEIKEDL